MPNTNHSSIVFVAGATGYLGSEICHQLILTKQRVRGLIRSTSDLNKVARLQELGIETIEGDLKDRVSLEKALQGISVVISTVSSTLSRQDGDSIQSVDEEGQINLINAAVKAGVKQFIYISFCELGECPLQTAKRKVEKHLQESGLNFTVLQPTYFMEVWLSPVLGFDYPNSRATIYGQGNNRISWIALKDVASFAVAAIDNPVATNKTIPLGGPDPFSPLEVVNIFETTKGTKFELQFVPMEALQAQFDAAGDPLSKSFATLMLGVVNGSEIEMTTTLNDFPIQLTSVNDYAKG